MTKRARDMDDPDEVRRHIEKWIGYLCNQLRDKKPIGRTAGHLRAYCNRLIELGG